MSVRDARSALPAIGILQSFEIRFLRNWLWVAAASPAKSKPVKKKKDRAGQANSPMQDGDDGTNFIVSDVIEQVAAHNQQGEYACQRTP